MSILKNIFKFGWSFNKLCTFRNPRMNSICILPTLTGTVNLKRITTFSFENECIPSSDELEHLRSNLYPDNPEVSKLYNAKSIQEVFNLVQSQLKENGELDSKIASQALVSIYDITKLINRYYEEDSFKEVKKNNIYNIIINNVVDKCTELNESALSTCILSLRKLNYRIKSLECRPLLNELLSRNELSYEALSKLFTSLRNESLFGRLTLCELYPNLQVLIENVKTDMDLRLISICIRASSSCLNEKLLSQYKELVNSFLDDPIKSTELEANTLSKIFLALFDSFELKGIHEDNYLLTKVGKFLATKMDSLTSNEIIAFHRYIEYKRGPVELYNALNQRLSRLIEVEDDNITKLELFSIYSPMFKNIRQRKKVGKFIESFLNEIELPSQSYITILIKCLKNMRSSQSLEIYKKFWTSFELDPSDFKFNIQLGLNYLSFFLSVRCRNFNFEFKMKEIFNLYIYNYVNRIASHTVFRPRDFPVIFSYLIAFGSPHDLLFELRYFKIIQDFVHQFKLQDLNLLARGLDTQLDYNNYRDFPRLVEISSIIEEQCTELKFNTVDNEADLLIGRILLAIRKNENSPLFEDCIESYDLNKLVQGNIEYETRYIGNLLSIMISSNYYSEKLISQIQDYLKAQSHLDPFLIERFLSALFVLGIDIVDHELLSNIAKAIERNKESYSTLVLLNSTMFLCYCNSASSTLINHIFSVNFLDQVDEEISVAFGSGYPLKLRQIFMDLNRAVCISMPHCNVPWFHEKFCENINSVSHPPRDTYLHEEIENILSQVIGLSFVQRNTRSPYFYHIDFQIDFDKNKRPIKAIGNKSSSSTSTEASERVAIKILNPGAWTKGTRNLKGSVKQMKKHLEILGYKVILIDSYLFNSLHMSEMNAKQNYIEKQLFG